MKITHQNALTLRAALLALDGLDKCVEVKGQTQLVKKPFKFSGQTRLKIARNLRAIEAIFQDYDAARVGLVRELADGGEAVPADKLAEFNQRHTELLREETDLLPCPLTSSELNLDDNEIPHAAIAVLLKHLMAECDEGNFHR